MPGNLVYIKFNKLKVKTRRGKKKNLIREEAVHAVAEEFLDLRLGHHFFFNHWIYLFPVWLKRAADHCNECPLCSNKHPNPRPRHCTTRTSRSPSPARAPLPPRCSRSSASPSTPHVSLPHPHVPSASTPVRRPAPRTSHTRPSTRSPTPARCARAPPPSSAGSHACS